ncbi:hypothetical protein FB45DRAFT_179322 [Roridomyces roridus]|uniref:MYND-type domain-containing protein n=1 Tax=Roridomyces roridus TaxID=1738132 RepID=A0AAD7CE41_9AGAR|nr:hypothetical protein FB45DRAFT_179322 [Roridomyces roridus]
MTMTMEIKAQLAAGDDIQETLPESESARECANVGCIGGKAHPGSLRGKFVCSGCEGVRYCSYQCQAASWAAEHGMVCTAPRCVEPSGIHLRVKNESEEGLRRETMRTGEKTVNVEIIYTRSETATTCRVGNLILSVIDLEKARRLGFSRCLHECSTELAHLSAEFDSRGRIRPNNGCWQPEDLDRERQLVYLQKLIIDVPWQGKGIGRSIFPLLFEEVQGFGAGFIFTWPSVLNDLEPVRQNFGSDGYYRKSTPAEKAAYLAKFDRIVDFYRKAGFRRVINSHFFCLAKDPSHASHCIPVDEDATYQLNFRGCFGG